MDVSGEHADQADAEHPQQEGPRHEVTAEPAKRLGVLMDLCRALVDVEVADHVHHDEAKEADAGDGHHVLLADGGLVEVERPGKLRCPPAEYRHRVVGAGHGLCH